MASDEELARRIAEAEQNAADGAEGSAAGLDEFRETASEIHDELARRIERVDESAVDADELAAMVERIERLEERLDDLESDL